jgi:hypothetical protein
MGRLLKPVEALPDRSRTMGYSVTCDPFGAGKGKVDLHGSRPADDIGKSARQAPWRCVLPIATARVEEQVVGFDVPM